MNLDEQILKRVDKGYSFELWNENVIISTQFKIQKGQIFQPFFLSELKIFNELFNECSMNFFITHLFMESHFKTTDVIVVKSSISQK